MRISDIWNFAAGYVIIEIHGLKLEKMISAAAKYGVYISDSKRVSYTVIRTQVSFAAYIKLKSVADEYSAEVRVIEAHGLAKLPNFIRRRYPVLIGMCIISALLSVLSGFVFNISILGADQVSEFEISNIVQSQGIGIGTPKSSVDMDAVKKAIKQKFPEITYVNTYFDGVSFVVNLIEGTLPPELADEDVCNIVASKDALIEKVTALSGKPVVKAGEVVKAGQVLISGIYSYNETQFFRPSRGEIIAKVWYYEEYSVNTDDFMLEGTGEKVFARYVRVGRFRWLAGIDDIPYDKYVISGINDEVLGENMVFPVHIMDVEIEKAKSVDNTEGKERAKIEAREKAYYNALSKMPQDAEILKMSVDYEESTGHITAQVNIETRENIAQKEYIGG